MTMYQVSNSHTHVYQNYNIAKGKWPASSGTSGVVNVVAQAQAQATTSTLETPIFINRMRQPNWNGRLSKLMEMPVDILFEVFGRLHPSDLLNLSRTNKAYRRFFLDRQYANLWRVSFRNIPGIPEPFEDMSFPAWAQLLFCDRCHFCDYRPSNIDWTYKLRVCERCVHQVLGLTYTEVPDTVHPRSLAARAFRERIHVDLCKTWDVAKVYKTPTDIQAERIRKIKSNLSALGWGGIVLNYVERSFVLSNLVSKAQVLTDEVWDEIGPYIISHLQDRLRQGLSFDLKVTPPKLPEDWDGERSALAAQFWRNYKTTHYDSATEALPTPLEFISMKAVAEILRCPKHVVVTLESFNCLLPMMPEMIEKWRQNVRMLEG